MLEAFFIVEILAQYTEYKLVRLFVFCVYLFQVALNG